MKLNLPNFLTIFRIICVPIIALLIILSQNQNNLSIALTLFILAAFTDYLDGLTARTLNQSTEFGKVLDPIADKLMTVILLCVLYGSKIGSDFPIIFGIPVVVIIFREIFISGLREYIGTKSEVLQVSWFAKIKTALQLLSIGILILSLIFQEINNFVYLGLLLIWLASILTIVSGFDYFIKVKPYIKE